MADPYTIYNMDGTTQFDPNAFYNGTDLGNPNWSQVNDGAGYNGSWSSLNQPAPSQVAQPQHGWDGAKPNPNADQARLPSDEYYNATYGTAPSGRPYSPNVKATPAQLPANMTLPPVSKPSSGIPVRTVTTVQVNPRTGMPAAPATSRPHWSQSWLANATRDKMTRDRVNQMPIAQQQRAPLQFTVRGGNPAAPTPASRPPALPAALPPPPQTWQGTSTGNQYNIGQTYQAAGYQYLMTPNGPVNVGRVNPALTPAQTYNAASNYDPVPNGREWMAGTSSGGGGRYDLG